MARCQLAAGFLVQRQCENGAIAVCSQCGRPICALHSVTTDQGITCTVCGSDEGDYYDEDSMYDDDYDVSDDSSDDVFTDDDDELFQAGEGDEDEGGELS